MIHIQNHDGGISKEELRSYLTKTIKVAKEMFKAEVKEDGDSTTFKVALKIGLHKMQDEVIEEILDAAFLLLNQLHQKSSHPLLGGSAGAQWLVRRRQQSGESSFNKRSVVF